MGPAVLDDLRTDIVIDFAGGFGRHAGEEHGLAVAGGEGFSCWTTAGL
jgi:hypothetical protein